MDETVRSGLAGIPDPYSYVAFSQVYTAADLERCSFFSGIIRRDRNGVNIDKTDSMPYNVFRIGGVYPPVDEPLKGGDEGWLRTRI